MTGHYIVVETKGQAVLKPFEVPEPKAGEVLLENDYTVVSAGTERANLVGLPNTSGKFPFYPGYGGIGRVLALGDGVGNVEVGERALAHFSGHRSHAIQRAAGMTVVRNDRIESLDAAFIVIAAMGLQGVRKLKLEVGESVMIIGLGLLGVFAVQSASFNGAIPVIVSDFDAKRRELALTLGADHAFSPDEPNLSEKVKELTCGRGADAVVEVTGAAVALQQALDCVRREGRVALLGCTRVSEAPIDFYKHVHHPGVSLIGAHTFVRPQVESRPGYWTTQDDYRTLLAFLGAGRLKVRSIISEVVSPVTAPEVYCRLAEDPHPPLGIVFDWGELR
ncbi:MAG: zinc-binding alcohol dehydrogenase [Armatimonadetes bacterium]|nr:zinc-binding alcohol dehydrogenase [Armatimonadota bacterium]NDK12317.1 zinc-binding alcohol dehydrogenase [Armatimonadota bacterium]